MLQKANQHKKAFIFSLTLLCFLMAGLFFLYRTFRPQAAVGTKNLVLEVIYADSSTDTCRITTNAEYLEQAIKEADDITIDGSRTEQFGLMILSVNGVEADYAKDHAYWAVLLDGSPCNYGISRQPVQDGEHYQLVYTPVK